jgi:lysophospholipase L1-like esterase
MWRYAADLKEPYDDPELPFHHYPKKGGHYYGVDIKTNSQGFRDREFSVSKPENVKRIMFLGDSFTLGWGVPFDSIYSKKLERELNKSAAEYEVINLGIGNYNNSMEVELFKRKGIQFDPDYVILMFYVNDAESTPITTTSVEYSLIKNSYLIAFFFDRYVKLRASFDKQFDWKKYYSGLYDKDSPSLRKNRAALKELIDICRKNEIGLLFVSIPELRELDEYPLGIATEFIQTIAEEGNIPFLDLLPVLSEYEPSSLWVTPEDPHANVKANGIIADAILQKFEKILRFSPH